MKSLRILSIILLVLTALMTLLGGAGTTCAAFNPEAYESMVPLIPYQWLYQVLVVTTLAAAVYGIWATYGFIRGRRPFFRRTLIFLVVGLILAGIQMTASNHLRGKSAPTNMRFYLTALTLLVLLLYRWRAARQGISGDGTADDSGTGPGTGIALSLGGLLVLSTPLWAGPSHLLEGRNWVYVLRTPLVLGGTLLVLAGLGMVVRIGRKSSAGSCSLHHSYRGEEY
jgi:hypothetical protein